MIFSGKVIKGLQIGAKFGIATANLECKKTPDLVSGVYLVEVLRKNTKNTKNKKDDTVEKVNGIMHFGELKTFGGSFTIEVHLFDFETEIYGEDLDIKPLKYLRETIKFQNADALFSQIETDIVRANKFFLRKSIYKNWEVISERDKDKMKEKAFSEIEKLEVFQNAKNVFIYAPEEHREIDFTQVLMSKYSEKKYFFPKVIKRTVINKKKIGEMIFCEVENYKDLVLGAFGILEPKGALETETKPDLIFVPAVMLDELGFRLGKGGGFYDQFLSRLKEELKTEVSSVSVVPEFAYTKNVPRETHDLSVDMVLTI